MTALSEANYILHTTAFTIFHVISLEQAMKIWRGNVLLEKRLGELHHSEPAEPK